MKEFIKWLGVNEKIAKLLVWVFFLMISLIIFNTFCDSIGLSYYKVSYENLSNIKNSEYIETVLSWIVTLLNFYAITLLVFRVKEAKKMLKYSVLYLILNILINGLFGKMISQIFIIIYILGFCYLYSGKNLKFILYGIISFFINALLQFITYQYKTKFFDYETINHIVKSILSLDYFIVVMFLILVKEIYIKRRYKKNGMA